MLNYPTEKEIKSKVERAINLLFKNDIYLLHKNVNERAIAHRLAVYLEKLFDTWNVDCEYNRMDNDPKRLMNYKNDDGDLVLPDIIVHHRGTTNNLLAIEIKKESSITPSNYQADIQKLKQYKLELDYKHVLFISFSTNSDPKVTRFDLNPN
ncbi:hypothetical protein GC093_20710 [Paenibacillus sp. LMG 31456]|uniref:Uncharacterized protein n=1 Tax=Paenibacillus foliorum TaxID=2654974 RepID=A0A972K459_9BACL|nr:hypothetical protein [Paenibacillus foliorum]NOU95632.1 hypothetical protein [Paenibacillus foliorum]